jgi:hypothetical protein
MMNAPGPAPPTAPPASSAWTRLRADFLSRVGAPWGRPKVILYLLIAIVIISGFSTWLSAGLHEFGQASPRDVAVSSITYVVAMLATATVDLLIDSSASGEAKLVIFLFAILSFFLLLWLTLPMAWMPGGSTATTHVAWIWAKLMVVSTPGWAIWWMVNGGDDRYRDTTNAAAAAGGNPLQGLGP